MSSDFGKKIEKSAACNLAIYYTSGTGNTYRVIRWIAQCARESGWEVDSLPMEKNQPTERLVGAAAQTVVLATPTHGFTTPWHVLRFTFSQLPRGKGVPAYCLATRAGFRIGSYITDGMAGTCAFLLALILALKGYRVRGCVHVNMPSNWYSLHPMQGAKTVEMILDRAEKQTREFVARVIANQRVWFTGNNLYEAVVGLVLAPISALYLAIGRFGLAKLYFANYRCNGCGICAKGCSFQAIEMRGKKNPRPFWRYNCESCMRCAALCPTGAIEASHSWLGILIYVSTIPLLHSLLGRVGEMGPILSGLQGSWIDTLLWLMYWYPAVFLSYYLFQALLRIRVINRLFTYTTLTHYWGRYKEPTVKLKDLMPGGKGSS